MIVPCWPCVNRFAPPVRHTVSRLHLPPDLALTFSFLKCSARTPMYPSVTVPPAHAQIHPFPLVNVAATAAIHRPTFPLRTMQSRISLRMRTTLYRLSSLQRTKRMASSYQTARHPRIAQGRRFYENDNIVPRGRKLCLCHLSVLSCLIS